MKRAGKGPFPLGIMLLLLLAAAISPTVPKVLAEEPKTAETQTLPPTLLQGEEEMLGRLIYEMRSKNPALQAQMERILASKEKVLQARAYMEPRLEIGIMDLPSLSWSLRMEGMTRKSITLSHEFESYGKRDLKGRIASKRVDVEWEKFRKVELDLRSKTIELYYEIAYLDAAISLMEESKKVLESFTKITESLYTVGEGVQQDILKAQVEQTKILTQIEDMRRMRDVMAIRLKRITYSDKIPAPLPYRRDVSPFKMTEEELLNAVYESHPMVKEMSLMREMDGLMVDMANREYKPDYMLMLSWGQRTIMEDLVSAAVSINLPVYKRNRQDAKLRESQKDLLASQKDLEDIKLEMKTDVGRLLREIETDWKLIGYYKDGLLPQAQASLESAITGYQVGNIDFLMLLDNQMTLLDLQIELERRITSYSMNVGMLRVMAGFSQFEFAEARND